MTSTTASGFALRRFVPAALFAATAALFISSFADPAIASAERVLNNKAFQDCLDKWVLDHLGEPDNEDATAVCCIEAGGYWDYVRNNCFTDDVERPLPPRAAPPAETSAPLEPVTPSTQTFMPGPARQG